MKVVYHPAVQRDVSRILRHYDGINDRLGDEFWEELNSFINQVVAAMGTAKNANHTKRVRQPLSGFDPFPLFSARAKMAIGVVKREASWTAPVLWRFLILDRGQR